jgi:hypothetical protein
MTKKGFTPTEQEAEAIRIMKDEKTNWEEGIVWVTDKVGFQMRNIIKKARKNYLSIYDDETDPLTGRKKIFVPFTEWTVENMYKNIDLDLKNIKVSSRKPDAYGISQLFKYILNCYLDKANFSYLLNESIKNGACVDGTAFLKAWREGKNLVIKYIDRLNVIIDPSAETIEESSSIIERNVLTLPEFLEYEFDNSEYVSGETTIDRTSFDNSMTSVITTNVPYVEVFERYGYLPRFCLTGREKDRGVYEYCLVVASGLNSATVIHEIKKVKSHPYGMLKLKTVKNRLDGRGVPEMVFNIQAYINEIINVRLNVARIAQTQLFKLRGNITPQQLKRLFQTGAIKLDSASDVEPIETGTIDPSSYNDEDRAYDWGQRVTQTVREDEVTASTPATNALLQERGSAKGYNQIQEGISIALSKFLEQKVTPIIQEIIKMEGVIKFSGDPKDIDSLDDKLAKNYLYYEMEKYRSQYGVYPVSTEEEIDQKISEIKDELRRAGSTRYLRMDEDYKKIFDTDYDIAIEMDDERINPSVQAQQLVQLMGIIAQAGYPIDAPMAELLDLMGLQSSRITQQMIEDKKKLQRAQAQQQMQGEIGGEVLPEAPEGEVTQQPNPNPLV